MNVSIIIPVLNEGSNLTKTLNSLQPYRQGGHEVIVVDGGSTDNSLALAGDVADQVIESAPGRAVQMNCGASVANGEVYLFLHADTVLPDKALDLITSVPQSGFYWGHFDIRLSSNRKIFRLIELMVNLRSRLTSIATGDQAMFIDAGLFKYIGGFPQIALMEDIAISRLLKNHAKPLCLKSTVITSSRRWETKGVIATVLLMWKLRLYYFLGVSPQKLSQLYR